MFGGVALLVAALAGQLWIVHMVRTAFEETARDPLHPVKISERDTLLEIMAVLAIPGIISVLAGFFLGMARIRRDAERAGLTGYSFNMGWTVGSFFIPLLNLYRPWVGLGEIRRSVVVALESRQKGKKWNRFGDLSMATITLAAAILMLAIAEIVYDSLTSVRGFQIHSLGQFYALLDAMRLQALINMVLLIVMAGAFLIYLETLRRASARLTALADEGALTPA